MADFADKPDPDQPRKPRDWKKAGAAVGIGSAAIVAALLYVNHAKKKPGNER